MLQHPVGRRPARRRRTPAETADRVGEALGVAGGLTAGVTGPLGANKGSWLAAYLVLICGIAQCLLSTRAATLGHDVRDRHHPWAPPAAWNAGNGLIVCGALFSQPPVAGAAGVLLFAGLGLATIKTRHTTRRRRAIIARIVYGLLGISMAISLISTRLRS